LLTKGENELRSANPVVRPCFPTFAPHMSGRMKRINFFGMNVPVPNHPVLRLVLGVLLVIGGVLGFLPVLGFWMVPLGLVVLSIDFPAIRRFRRRATVRLGLWMQERWLGLARRLGFSAVRPSRSAGM
jgi:hypothetical protein